jgi:hypothetical protein
MNDDKLFNAASEQEKELIGILLRSSLYQDMAPEDKQKLLNYLVTSYFNVLPGRNSRALPLAIQCGRTI